MYAYAFYSTEEVPELSDYVQALPKEARERYLQKLKEVGCTKDPYLDSFINQGGLLPNVKYANIFDFLIGSHMVNHNDPQRAFKSLDGYHMVVADGWMGNLNIKKWTNAVIVKCDVKPSQRSGTIYKTWVAIKPCRSVLCSHCTCMAGLGEVCNHVGAVLYKTMHEVSTTSEISCTSLPNAWLSATVKKTVATAQV